jgi:hypothetical protein
MDLGSGVIFAKVRDESEALQALGMHNRQDKPQVFSSLNISCVRRLENRLFGKDQIVYQQFIPPELTEEGYSRIIRGHFYLRRCATCFCPRTSSYQIWS